MFTRIDQRLVVCPVVIIDAVVVVLAAIRFVVVSCQQGGGGGCCCKFCNGIKLYRAEVAWPTASYL